MRILRQTFATVIGMIAGGITVMLIESISMFLHPMPPGVTMDDPAAMKEWIATLPASAFLIVTAAWLVGGFTGAYIARLIAAQRSAWPAIIVLTLFVTAVVYNLVTIPSPWWMWPLGTIGTLICGVIGLVCSAPGEYTVETERPIRAPVDRVFATLARIENFSQAVPDIVNVEFLTDQQYGVGTRFRETRVMNGREAKATLEVVDLRENELIRLISDEGGTVWDTVFSVHPGENDTTRMTMRMDAKPKKFAAKLITPMITNMVARFVEKDMDSVQTYCETHTEETDK